MATEAVPTAGRRRLITLAVFGVLALVAGALTVAAFHHRSRSPSGSGTGATPVVLARHRPLPTLRLVAIAPAPGASGVGFSASITLRFSHALAKSSALPELIPALVGVWTRPSPAVLQFLPSEPYVPAAIERVVVREGRNGPVATDGGEFAAEVSSTFTIARGSVTRVQQMLAELDYLPVSFAPSGSGSARARAADALDAEGADPGSVARTPEPGSFIDRFSNTPSQLQAAFVPGEITPATTGAVMAFEEAHNITVDGEIGPKVWSALFKAVAARQVSRAPYDYLIVSETQPETLYVWRDGKVIYQSAANTGVDGAATALGTFPVYLRFVSTTMKGTNPDGTPYDDPGIPYVAYFNGSDAVHGYIRPGYGYPQSDGCVELPISHAAYVFGTDPLGTLVTVTDGDLSPELHADSPSYIEPSSPAVTTTTAPPAATTTTPPAPKRHRHRAVPTTSTVPTTVPTTSTVATTSAPTPTG